VGWQDEWGWSGGSAGKRTRWYGSLLRDGSGLAYSIGEWYHATAASASTAVVDLAVRNLPYTTQYGHYLLVLGLIVWATSMFASYAVFGHHHPLNAIVALGIVLLVTMSVSIDDQLRYLVVFSIAANSTSGPDDPRN